MKWAWRLARVRDVDINVHVTFVMFLAYLAIANVQRGGSAGATVGVLLFTMAVFASVLLHEWGHVTMARRFGIPTRRITLLPIGGVAELERMPERPREELLVTAAGPAVNIAIAIGLAIAIALTDASVVVTSTGLLGEGNYLARLMWVNVSLVVFNAIPAFPMDGGRILRALLAMRMDHLSATRTAASVGQAIALLFGFIGLFGNAMLLFIAFFVWIGAASEAVAAETSASLRGVPSGAAVEADIVSLRETDTLGTAADRLLAGAQRDFPVLDDAGGLAGVLTRDQLIRGLRSAGAEGAVREVMDRNVTTVQATEPLVDLLPRMQRRGTHVVAVTENGRVVGMITAENAAELVLVRGALRAHDASG